MPQTHTAGTPTRGCTARCCWTRRFSEVREAQRLVASRRRLSCSPLPSMLASWDRTRQSTTATGGTTYTSTGPQGSLSMAGTPCRRWRGGVATHRPGRTSQSLNRREYCFFSCNGSTVAGVCRAGVAAARGPQHRPPVAASSSPGAGDNQVEDVQFFRNSGTSFLLCSLLSCVHRWRSVAYSASAVTTCSSILFSVQ